MNALFFRFCRYLVRYRFYLFALLKRPTHQLFKHKGATDLANHIRKAQPTPGRMRDDVNIEEFAIHCVTSVSEFVLPVAITSP